MKTKDVIRTFGLLPPAFWVLAGGTFVNRFATFLVVFLTLYTTSLGYSPSQGGLAVMMYSIGGIASFFIAGPAAERFGRNRVMGTSLLIEAFCVLGMGFAETFPQILCASCAAGFASMGSHPAAAALLTDIVPPHHRTAAQLAMRLAINSGWAFGPMVAGLIAKHSYFVLFVCDAASSIIFGILCFTSLPRGQSMGKGGDRWLPALKIAARMKPFLALLLANAMMAFVFRQLTTTYPLQMEAARFQEETIGVMQGLNGVLIILVEIPLMAITAWMTLRGGIAAGAAILGLGMVVMLAGGGLWVFIAVMLIVTLGEMICFPRHAVYLANLSPVDMRARFAGMNSLAWAIGNLLGSLVGTLIYERVSPAALWWLCGAMGCGAAVVMMLGGRNSEAESMAREERAGA